MQDFGPDPCAGKDVVPGMKCPGCGKDVESDATFCPACGERLERETPVEPEQASAPSTSPTAARPPSPETPAGPQNSGWAMASLAFGIIGMTCLPLLGSVLAIIFGAVAKIDIRKRPGELKGSGLATAGIVLGTVMVVLIVVSAAVIIPISYIGVGPTQTMTRTVDAGDATTVAAALDMSLGKMRVSGGGPEALQAAFTYNMSKLKPEVSYSVSGRDGELLVSQPSTWWFGRFHARNEWDIRLSSKIPTTLKASLSAGDGTFELGNLSLQSLDLSSSGGEIYADLTGKMPLLKRVSVKQSAGQITLRMDGQYSMMDQLTVSNSFGNTSVSLVGKWSRDLDGTINSSAGQVRITLPADVGVSVKASASVGRVVAGGLKNQSGDVYVNDAFGHSKTTLHLNVKNSAGDIILSVGG